MSCENSLDSQTSHLPLSFPPASFIDVSGQVQDNDSDGAADYRLESAENALDADIKTTCQEPTDEKKARFAATVGANGSLFQPAECDNLTAQTSQAACFD